MRLASSCIRQMHEYLLGGQELKGPVREDEARAVVGRAVGIGPLADDAIRPASKAEEVIVIVEDWLVTAGKR